MKFQGSLIGKVFLILLCLILGIVIAVGGEVGAIYYILTKSTVADVGDKLSSVLPGDQNLEFDDEVKNMTVLDWGKDLINMVGNMDTTTVGQLEGMIGTSAVSKALYEIIGVDTVTVKAATFSGLGEAISGSLTLGTVSDKFNIALPDMPLFSDTEFMNEPLTTAFEGLTDKQLKQFINMNEGETNAVLLKMQNLTISELGTSALTDTINEMKLEEIIDIEEGRSNAVLVALRSTTVGELGGENADSIVNSLFLSEIMTIDDSSEQILQALKYSTLGSKTLQLNKTQYDEEDFQFRNTDKYLDVMAYEVDGYEYIYGADGTPYVFVIKDGEKVYDPLTDCYTVYETKFIEKDGESKNRPIIGVNDTIGTLKIKDVMDTSDNRIMQSLSESTLNSLGDDINKLFLDEIMEITDASGKTMKALRYAALKTAEVNVNPLDVVSHAEPSKELPGYIYRYVLKDGEYIPYVAKIGADGNIVTNAGFYVFIETKEYAGYYRPIMSIDECVERLFMAELIDAPESQTLKSLTYSSLSSQKASIAKAELDASTATYKASAAYDSMKEGDGFVYMYSSLGLAYVCVTDEDGDPIMNGANYDLYETKFYEGKYYPLRGIDDKIKVITFGEVVEIDMDDPDVAPLMKNLKNTRVDKMNVTVNQMFMGEMMDITVDSANVLKAIKYSTLKDGIAYIDKEEANAATAACRASAAYDPDKELDDYTYYYMVDEKGRYVPYVYIETVGETYKVYETKETEFAVGEPKYYPIIGLDHKLQDLKMGDVFDDEDLDHGVLSLIGKETKVDDLDTAVSNQLTDATLAKLNGVGVLEINASSMAATKKEQKAFIWNNSMSSMLDGVFDFIGNPVTTLTYYPYYQVNYDKISAPMKNVPDIGSPYTLTEFLALYNQYDELELNETTYVTLDEVDDAAFYDEGNELFIMPIFQLKDTAYSLVFQTTKDVALGVYDYDEHGDLTGLSKHQYYYAYDASASGAGSSLNYFSGYAAGAPILGAGTDVGGYREYTTVTFKPEP